MKKEANPTFLSATAGAARYEFRMQIRRRSVWIVLLLGDLLMLSGTYAPWKMPASMPLAEALGSWAFILQIILPLAFGILLADRLPRDRRTGASELLETLPAPSGGRLAGKFLGGALATMTPIFLFYCAGVVYLLVDRGEWTAVPLGLAAFALVNLPGLLFVGAFSVSCPAVLWVPLYQFLFTGYWFWGNWLLQGPQSPLYTPVPSTSGTLLTPAGYYAAIGIFGVEDDVVRATPWEGAASVGLLLGLAVAALFCAHRYLRWQRARQ